MENQIKGINKMGSAVILHYQFIMRQIFISLFSKFSAFSEAIFRKRILLKSVNISKSFLSPTYILNIFTVEFKFIFRLLSFLDFFFFFKNFRKLINLGPMYVNSGVESRDIPLFLYSLCVREGRKFLLFHFVFFSSTNSSEAPPDSLLATGISAVHFANGGYIMLTYK